jgi:3-hydroxy-3-methylglutaryl CoA synthase
MGKGTEAWTGPERAVCNFDEDSLTMGVAAALDCIGKMDRSIIDGVYFATTTSPYTEKQVATTIATACDLRPDVFTTDLGNSLRAGTDALRMALDAVKAGSLKNVLVVAADNRVGRVGSDFERNGGDGAAAVLVSNTNVIAELEGAHAITDEMQDVWRSRDDNYLQAWEDRFVLEEGYLRVMALACTECMKKLKLTPKDITKAAYFGPDARRHGELARMLGLDPKTQVQDPLFGSVGTTGTAQALMCLVGALEDGKAGNRLVCASYGNGADTFIFKVTDQISKATGHRAVKKNLASKKMIDKYATYLDWRGILVAEAGARRPPLATPSPSVQLRERDWNIRLYGAKCKTCGTLQYPPQRVCTKCMAKDNFDKVRLSDKRATMFTYSMDYISGSKDVPLVISIINFEGGGRMLTTLTDRDIKEIKIGMPLEMAFRQLHVVSGIHNYYWKVIPVRA